ncbi:MAG TPA: TspO/MBR family protein [Allosphingosinicella sp.]|nr:TspO/MBR family protein [Allosphingosinicella sp.]
MTAIASTSQLRMSFLRYALITVPAVLLLGTLSGRASNSSYGNAWFDALVKPEAMPPGWAFGVAWTVLYILLGLSLALILHARGAQGRGAALAFFFAQLLVNYAWSPVFFGMNEASTALILIVLMLLLATVAAFLFARIRKAAGLLMLPYLAWLCFATFLNYQIIQLNPDADTLVPQPGSADIAL